MTADTLKRPLTPAESELAGRYHNLIYRVMRDMHIVKHEEGDFYGDCALALLLAAERYVQTEAPHKYSFTTIAYRRIRTSIENQFRAHARRPICASLDAVSDAESTLYDVMPDTKAANPEAIALRRLVPSVKATLRHKKLRVVNGGLMYRQEAA